MVQLEFEGTVVVPLSSLSRANSYFLRLVTLLPLGEKNFLGCTLDPKIYSEWDFIVRLHRIAITIGVCAKGKKRRRRVISQCYYLLLAVRGVITDTSLSLSEMAKLPSLSPAQVLEELIAGNSLAALEEGHLPPHWPRFVPTSWCQ